MGNLNELGKIILTAARDQSEQKLFNEYIERYHYLGYKKPFGNVLRYFVSANENIVGCILIAGAAKSITVRDQKIGWDRNQRINNLPWVINNSRFLILPWVKVPHLASHILGKLTRQIRNDCQRYWGYAPLLLETFVDPKHYQGTCYKAANWIYLGQTTGQGYCRPGKFYETTPKMVFVYPLVDDAYHQLSSQNLLTQRGAIKDDVGDE